MGIVTAVPLHCTAHIYFWCGGFKVVVFNIKNKSYTVSETADAQ